MKEEARDVFQVKFSGNLELRVHAKMDGLHHRFYNKEMFSTLENAERLYSEMRHLRKYKKSLAGDDSGDNFEESLELQIAKASSLTDQLVADMRTVRTHGNEKKNSKK